MKILQICIIISALQYLLHARVIPTQTNYKSLIGNAFLNGYGVLEENIVIAINNLEESPNSSLTEEPPNTDISGGLDTDSEIIIVPKSTIGINNIFTQDILLQQLRNKTKDNVAAIITKPKPVNLRRYQNIDTAVKKKPETNVYGTKNNQFVSTSSIPHQIQNTYNNLNNNNGQLSTNLFHHYTNNHNANKPKHNITGVIEIRRDKENSSGNTKSQGSITRSQALIHNTNNQHLTAININNKLANILSQNHSQINKYPLLQNQVNLNRVYYPNSMNINGQTSSVSIKNQNFASINNKNEMRHRGQNYNQIANNQHYGSANNLGVTRVRSYNQNGNNQIFHSTNNSRVQSAYQNIRNQNFANVLATNRQVAAARDHARNLRTHQYNVPVTKKPFVIFA